MNAAWNALGSQLLHVYHMVGERRRMCRYAVKRPEAQVGWWQRAAFSSFPCKLVDLSIQGAYIESDRRPAPLADQAIRLRPAGMDENQWIEGSVVAARRSFFGSLKIRIHFDSPLGYELFNQFVYGRDHILDTPLRDLPDRELPEHERDNLWR